MTAIDNFLSVANFCLWSLGANWGSYKREKDVMWLLSCAALWAFNCSLWPWWASGWLMEEEGVRIESPDVASVPTASMTGGNTGGSHHHCPSGQTVALCVRPDGGHADTCPLLRGHTDTKGGHRWTLEGKHRGHRSHTIIQNTGREEVAQGPVGEK